jgi:hypothetical protein
VDVIATMADTVPAVQALGQCIFLPMLILGGVAVKLSAFEGVPWVLHLSAFFPGRYAVEVMQQCAKGDGLGPVWFSALAVVLTGLGAGLTGAKLFRWDAHQRFLAGRNKGWLAATLAVWVLIGVGAEYRREIAPRPTRRALPRPAIVPGSRSESPASPTPEVPPQAAPPPVPSAPAPAAPAPPVEVKTTPVVPPPAAVIVSAPTETPSSPPPQAAAAPVAAAKAEMTAAPVPANPAPAAAPAPWRAYTRVDFARLDVHSLPPDNGNVTPIAAADDEPDLSQRADLNLIETGLPKWEPAQVADPVQRVRNVLYIAGLLDESQTNTERYVPYVIMRFLQQMFPAEELAQILCWIANHPNDGDHSAIFRVHELGVFANVDERDVPEIRRRNEWYASKFVWWLLGW